MEQLGIHSNFSKEPLAYLSRPQSLEDFVGQGKAVGIIKKMIQKKEIVNIIIYGPPGTGKTTISKIIAKELGYNFQYLNAINSGVSNVKEVSQNAKTTFNLTGEKTILLFDEIHRFNRMQQDSLLQDLEDGSLILIGSTTENPYYSLNKALISRCIVIEFKKLSDEDIAVLVKRIANKNNILIDDDILKYIYSVADGDARLAINILDLISKTDLETVKSGINIKERYDDSNKYDRISAMIKSIRGSDVDSAIYWMSSMLVAGEDPMYIARRLVISASEDIGLANPNALNVAVSAMLAVEKIGMPEARIMLSECIAYLALSPKSNSTYLAVDKAIDIINQEGVQDVPLHLTKKGASLYKYPHNFEDSYIHQEYMNKKLKIYEAKSNKIESALNEAWKKIREKHDRK